MKTMFLDIIVIVVGIWIGRNLMKLWRISRPDVAASCSRKLQLARRLKPAATLDSGHSTQDLPPHWWEVAIAWLTINLLGHWNNARRFVRAFWKRHTLLVICSWCGKVKHTARFSFLPWSPVSNSICPECKVQLLAATEKYFSRDGREVGDVENKPDCSCRLQPARNLKVAATERSLKAAATENDLSGADAAAGSFKPGPSPANSIGNVPAVGHPSAPLNFATVAPSREI